MVRWEPLACLAGCAFHPGAAATGAGSDARGGEGPADTSATADVPNNWWNPAWGFRLPITIHDTSTDNLATGFQIGLSRDLGAAPCTSNRDDIRIVYGITDLERVIDEVGAPEYVWFRLQAPLAAGATSTGEYWLYCGNPSPPAALGDPKLVFELYDPFDTLDTGVWTTKNAVSVSSGQLVTGGGGSADNGIVTTTLAFSKNHAADWIATTASASTSNFWAGFQNGTNDVAPWIQWWTQHSGKNAPDYWGTSAGSPWYGTDWTLDTQPHLYGVENYGIASMYRLDDTVYQHHVYAPMAAPPAMVNVRLWNGSSSPIVHYDMVRVRLAVDPPPTVTVGAPEAL